MTRLERYKEKLEELKAKRSMFIKTGNLVKACSMNESIQEVEKSIKEAEEYEESCKAKAIRELVSDEELHQMGIIPLMIECHLIADLLVDASYMIVDICKKYGFQDVSLMPDLKDLIKRADCFASFLTTLSPELCDILVRNDTLNTSLHKKYQKYIAQRLITKN